MHMRSLVLFSWCVFLSLSTACLGDEGSLGSQLPPEALEPSALADSLVGAVVCEPGRTFCDGAHLFSCSRSGKDAFSLGTCAGGSANNPVGCFTTECPGGATACCRPEKVRCEWSFTSPAFSGRTYESDKDKDTEGYCSAPSTCEQRSLEFSIASPLTTGTCPVLASRSIHVTVGRPLPIGQIVTLPDSRVSIHSGSATTACSAWTGTLIVHSDIPSWRVSLDVTCSNPGASDIRLVGSASGDV